MHTVEREVSPTVEVSDQGCVVHSSPVLDLHQLRLRHHWISPEGIQADVLADLAPVHAQKPDEVRGSLKVGGDAAAVVGRAEDAGGAEVHLPALAVGGGVPVVAPCLPPSDDRPLEEDGEK
eukprot:765148-Hanusia_phi.AAC.2